MEIRTRLLAGVLLGRRQSADLATLAEKAKLHQAIAQARCRHCLTVGQFRAVGKNGRVRYRKCRACGKTAGNQVAV